MAQSGAELQEQINRMSKLQGRYLLASIGSFLVVLALGSLMMVDEAFGYGCPVFALAGVVLLLLHVRAKRMLKRFVGETVTRSLLEEAFEVLEYDHRGRFGKSFFDSFGVILGWNRISCSDYMRGKYKGYGVTLRDVHLEHVRYAKHSRKRIRPVRTTVFKGPWIILEHDRCLRSAIRVRDRSFLGRMKVPGGNGIETESAAFNAQFQINADDGHTVFWLLTPHFMEYLSSEDAKTGGRKLLCFAGNSISIAIDNHTDSFEYSGKLLKDVGQLREAQRADRKALTDLLDELMRNDSLFIQ